MKRLLLLMFAFLLLLPIEANSQRKRNQKDNSKNQKVSLGNSIDKSKASWGKALTTHRFPWGILKDQRFPQEKH